ncbi:TlpA family protein disulfide reductase [Flavobacterium phycosphaerae]|uniref:TlpA family protein disulfide reductase n=1 Tax=Flavobacterium phycosphaerae TaxID=2697515 RepID=UPI00138A3945|nr:TlpA disulfide reductase family protein [Flavobacterium phycosphaerae]
MKKLLNLLLLFVGFASFSQKQLPNISLSDIDGKKMSVTTDFMEKDKIYIFSFWATWCTPCISELDEMNDVQEEWKKTLPIEIVAVATDDSRTQKRIKPLVNGKGWDYKVLLDSNQELKRALGIVNIPYTVVVKNGAIVHIQNGYVPGNENDLLAKLKTL